MADKGVVLSISLDPTQMGRPLLPVLLGSTSLGFVDRHGAGYLFACYAVKQTRPPEIERTRQNITVSPDLCVESDVLKTHESPPDYSSMRSDGAVTDARGQKKPAAKVIISSAPRFGGSLDKGASITALDFSHPTIMAAFWKRSRSRITQQHHRL